MYITDARHRRLNGRRFEQLQRSVESFVAQFVLSVGTIGTVLCHGLIAPSLIRQHFQRARQCLDADVERIKVRAILQRDGLLFLRLAKNKTFPVIIHPFAVLLRQALDKAEIRLVILAFIQNLLFMLGIDLRSYFGIRGQSLDDTRQGLVCPRMIARCVLQTISRRISFNHQTTERTFFFMQIDVGNDSDKNHLVIFSRMNSHVLSQPFSAIIKVVQTVFPAYFRVEDQRKSMVLIDRLLKLK